MKLLPNIAGAPLAVINQLMQDLEISIQETNYRYNFTIENAPPLDQLEHETQLKFWDLLKVRRDELKAAQNTSAKIG